MMGEEREHYRERHKRCPFLSLATDEGWYRVVARCRLTWVKARQLLDTNPGLPDSKRDIFCGAPCMCFTKQLNT